MKIAFYSTLFTLCIFFACKQSPFIDNSPAGIIVNKAIEAHGGDAYQDAFFVYDFRDKSYVYDYEKGNYTYERIFQHKKGNIIRDVLTNDSFKRSIDGRNVSLSDKRIKSYSESVNSVHYFTFLPFFLNDPSVKKEVLEDEMISNKKYHKIKITFSEKDGGADHDDVYVYWFDKDSHTMDYLAYSYENSEEKGVRFRVANNPRVVEGIRFQDYINYKHQADTPVEDLASFYNKQQLTELSRIDLNNIRPLKRKKK